MRAYNPLIIGCYEGWERLVENPVISDRLGGRLGVEESADPCVVRVGGRYYLFATWLSQRKITFFTSDDGVTWSEPQIHLYPRPNLKWEQKITKPFVLHRDNRFHMWYTAQTYEKPPYIAGRSCIAHAASTDGSHWDREEAPVLEPAELWERESVMYPSVLWDEENQLYQMWYSAGDYDYPDAIGYATSLDGISWTRASPKPVLERDASLRWEREKIGACHVVLHRGWYYMLYVAYEHQFKGRLCLARSRDGVHWERHENNPIITGGKMSAWDCEAVDKAHLLFEDGNWRMWYTGRRGFVRQIGAMKHAGEDLGSWKGLNGTDGGAEHGKL